MDSTLASQSYFHGLLPREDIPVLLKKQGDFLVRTTEPIKGQPRVNVISLRSPTPTEPNLIRHFIIRQEHGKFYIHKRLFESIHKLVDYHRTSKEPLNATAHETQLINPIPRQDWELLHSEIIVSKQIGEGAFGAVCLGKWTCRSNGATVDCAIKQAKIESLTKEQIKEVMMEARVMRLLDHPNVIHLHGVAALQEPLMLVMEFAKNGALDSYLTKNEISLEKKFEMSFQAACGIHYLHESGLLHRDIAARNCLYSEGHVKVSDFGLTREGPTFDIDPKKPIPIKWVSPEALSTAKFTYKTDVWSFGVLCYEIFSSGKEPYAEYAPVQVLKRVKEGHRLTFPEDSPGEIKYYVLHRIFAEEIHRPTMADVVKYWETSFGFTAPKFTVKSRDQNVYLPLKSHRIIRPLSRISLRTAYNAVPSKGRAPRHRMN